MIFVFLDRDESGVIENRGYENNEYKVYLIFSACAAVRIVSDFFATEEGYDFLFIEPQGAKIRHEGFNNPLDVVIEKSDVVLTFKSDDSETYSGFTLRWFCNG